MSTSETQRQIPLSFPTLGDREAEYVLDCRSCSVDERGRELREDRRDRRRPRKAQGEVLVRGAVHVAAGAAADFVVRLASVSILARLLVPEHFGLVAMVTAITAIAAQVSQLGLSAATVQRSEINHGQVSNLFWINVGAGVFLCAAISSLAPWIAAFYNDPRLVPLTVAVSTSFLWGGLTVQHEALLARQMKLSRSVLARLSATVSQRRSRGRSRPRRIRLLGTGLARGQPELSGRRRGLATVPVASGIAVPARRRP